MKKAGKYIFWITGIIVWLFLLMMFWMADMTHKTFSHLLLLIITGVCLTLYIYRKTDSRTKELEQENQRLRAENEQLRAELQEQAVQQVINKVENRGEGR